MSGIVGCFHPTGETIDADAIVHMCEQLAHRGPDGGGHWSSGPVALGHQLLHTTPESRFETLPDVDGSLAITADARIDNRDELLETLPVEGDPSRITDSRLILEAYREWGDRCPEHLLGAFAFAIWNGDAEQLFLARDHVGVKPLYYCNSTETFAFGSEIKALTGLESVPQRPNEVMIGDYLTSTFEDVTATFFDEIRRLEPAHAMTVDEAGASTRRYWALDPTRELDLGSQAAYVERFRERFTEAVRCRLRSAYPVGSTLSGGLDSSAITLVANEQLGEHRPLHTFSAVFDRFDASDEREYVEPVVDRPGIVPHFVHADETSPLTDAERVFWHHDEPFHNPMHFMHWEIGRRAAANDVRVLHSGFYGDLAVGYGFHYLPELARRGRWLRLASEVRGIADRFGLSRRGVFWKHVVKPLTPLPVRRAYRRFRGHSSPVTTANETIDETFAEAIELDTRLRRVDRELTALEWSERRAQHLSLTTGSIPFTLEVNDGAMAAFGIEPRYPFLDVRLLEYSLAVPPQHKIERGWTRWMLREAMADHYPPTVRWRPWKTDLGPVFVDGLLRYERDAIERYLVDDPGGLDRYLDLDCLRDVYSRYVDHRGIEEARLVWKALTLAIWLDGIGEQFEDENQPLRPFARR